MNRDELLKEALEIILKLSDEEIKNLVAQITNED